MVIYQILLRLWEEGVEGKVEAVVLKEVSAAAERAVEKEKVGKIKLNLIK
jgi:hypothetical protein